MNSRIGADNSTSNTHISILENIIPAFCTPRELPPRSACDHTVNQYGKTSFNFTCFTSRGCSTVDLIIGSKNAMQNIRRLRINPPEFSSVHSPVSVTIKCHTTNTSQNRSESVPLPPKLRWDPTKANEFRIGLLSPGKKGHIDAIVHKLSKASDSNGIDTSVDNFNLLMISEAKNA